MRKVTVKKTELVSVLEKNLEAHILAYKEAVAGYKEQALQRLETAIKQARKKVSEAFDQIKTKIENFGEEPLPDTVTVVNTECFMLRVPKSQEKSYAIALAMARMEVSDTIELSQDEFQCFVLDDWDWKAEFTEINKSYTSNMGSKR